MSYSVVWFKRDLRVQDHVALSNAVRAGPVLCVYCVEPALWRQPDMSTQHYQFTLECLRDLWGQLKRMGLQLQVVCDDAPLFFAKLYAIAPFAAIYSHEETGNAATYERDKAVEAWRSMQSTPSGESVFWHQYPQFGVVRGGVNRDKWHHYWMRHMTQPPELLENGVPIHNIALPWQAAKPPDSAFLGLAQPDKPARQKGGRAAGLEYLASFVQQRSANYRGGISSPISAEQACSRLSPYLSSGCLSVREVVQRVQLKQANLGAASTWQKAGLAAFTSRLHWHCHFIQKLESEPAIEFENMHRGYDGLREREHKEAHLVALKLGRTGWPLVDACVAMLRQTGWINFRMRAMLVSVAAYPLWLHWRPVGEWLAQEFLDYEPGIHWSQLQMQSGTTGINVPRVYNPIKQARDQDPNGHFVRRWLPAMRQVPDAWLFEPWRMPHDMQVKLGLSVEPGHADIPMPLVDLTTATRQAKAQLFALRAQANVKAGMAAIIKKHASRTFQSTNRGGKLQVNSTSNATSTSTSTPKGTAASKKSVKREKLKVHSSQLDLL